jgi:anti-anti-sigma factor
VRRQANVEENMDIQTKEMGGISVVSVNGNVFQENVAGFKKALLALVDKGKVKIVLDLLSSIYISSLCLAAIVDIKKKANEHGGDLKLARISKLAQNLLEATNLVRKIETFSDVDEAVKSFGSPSPQRED